MHPGKAIRYPKLAPFHEEKIQSLLGAMLLDAMDEKIIRVQFMGHYQIINPSHHNEYLAGTRALSIAASGWEKR